MNSRRSSTSCAVRVAIGPTRLPVRGSSWPPVSSAVTPGLSCSAANVSCPLVTTVRSRTSPRWTDRRWSVVEASMPMAPPSPTSGASLAAMRSLARTWRLNRSANGWGPMATAPPADPLHHALLGEHVEVAADGHLADVELAASSTTLTRPSLRTRASMRLQPVDRVDAHRRTRPSVRRDGVGRRPGRRTRPRAMPCTRALPSAVASTGPGAHRQPGPLGKEPAVERRLGRRRTRARRSRRRAGRARSPCRPPCDSTMPLTTTGGGASLAKPRSRRDGSPACRRD